MAFGFNVIKLEIILFGSMKRLTKAEKIVLWDRVEENMELMDKITHDLQNTTAAKVDQPNN